MMKKLLLLATSVLAAKETEPLIFGEFKPTVNQQAEHREAGLIFTLTNDFFAESGQQFMEIFFSEL